MTLCALGMVLSNIGTQIAKLGLSEHQRSAKAEERSVFRSPLYLGGLMGMIAGAILDFVSLAFAAQSLLAPLAACTLLVNIVLAPFLVHEWPRCVDVVATLIITAGAVVAVSFAAHVAHTFMLQETLRLFLQPLFLAWAACMAAFGAAALAITHDGLRVHQLPGQSALPLAEAAKQSKRSWRCARPRPTSYAFLLAATGGLSAGNSLLFAKAPSPPHTPRAWHQHRA
jgi:hypothetical protein